VGFCLVSAFLMTVSLTVSPILAGPRADATLREGADIAQYRTVHSEGLSAAEKQAAFVLFIRSFPQSPLAEIALAECLDTGLGIDEILGDLGAMDRTRLLARHRQHRHRLAREPVRSSLLTDGGSEGEELP
jgi:hypothetical protein